MKLSRMTNQQLIAYAKQFMQGMDKLMRRSCAGGLQYGWDMPTFGVLFPVERSRWHDICVEGRGRGLA
jgi:hypothetical protein